MPGTDIVIVLYYINIIVTDTGNAANWGLLGDGMIVAVAVINLNYVNHVVTLVLMPALCSYFACNC